MILNASLPYRQSYQFNAFGNLTQRNNRHWGVESWYGQSNNLSYTYKNNRVQGAGWQYDMDGRNLQTASPDDYASSVYNAAGQMIRSKTAQTDALRRYDGNGREIKRRIANFHETANSLDWVLQPTKYYIRSSVLGNEVVSEVWSNGRKGKTFVRAAGAQLAVQSAYASDTANLNEAVFFEYTDASGMSQRTTDKLGAATASGDGGEGSPVETDPLGGSVGTSTPYLEQLPQFQPGEKYPMLLPYFDDAPQYVNGQRVSCNLDGMAVGCSQAYHMLENGSAAQCPNNNCGPIPVVYNGRKTFAFFQAFGDGYGGFVPFNAKYVGKGLVAPIGGWLKDSKGNVAGKILRNDTNLSALNKSTNNERDLANLSFDIYMSLQEPKTLYSVTKEETNFLETEFEKLFVENKKCSELISQMLEIAGGSSNSFMDRFRERVANGITRIKDDNKGIGAWTSGTLSDPLLTLYNHGYYMNNPTAINNQLLSIIHEIFHIPSSGSYLNHAGMGLVAISAAQKLGLTIPTEIPKREDYSGEGADSRYSGDLLNVFTNLLKEYCSNRPKLRSGE